MFLKFCIGIYEETTGLCRNEKNDFGEIFSDSSKRFTLSECKNKCDMLDECGAVSCEPTGCNSCHGTSEKVTTTLEGNWVCYSKSGYKLSTYWTEI